MKFTEIVFKARRKDNGEWVEGNWVHNKRKGEFIAIREFTTNLDYPVYRESLHIKNKFGFWVQIDQILSCRPFSESDKIVMETNYQEASDFYEELAAVRDSYGKWGFIDKNYKEVIAPSYKSVRDFKNGFSIIKNDDNFYSFVDKTGEKKTAWYFDKMSNFRKFNEKLISIVIKNNKHAIIDCDGNFIVPFELYEDIDVYDKSDFKNQLIVMKDGIQGTLDRDFNFVSIENKKQ